MKRIVKFDVALVLSLLLGALFYYAVDDIAYEVTWLYPAVIWGAFWVLGVAFGVYACSDAVGFALPKCTRKKALVIVAILGALAIGAHVLRLYSAPFDNYFCEGSGCARFGKYGQMQIVDVRGTVYDTGIGTYYYARPDPGCLDIGSKIEGPVSGVHYRLPSLRPDIGWTVFRFEVTTVPTTVYVTDGSAYFPITIN